MSRMALAQRLTLTTVTKMMTDENLCMNSAFAKAVSSTGSETQGTNSPINRLSRLGKAYASEG